MRIILPKLTNAVYVIRKKSKVIYVGCSKNIFSRLASYNGKTFDEIEIIPTTSRNLSKLEIDVIQSLKPSANLKHNGQKSENCGSNWREWHIQDRKFVQLKCFGCNHEWMRRGKQNPKVCPKCKRTNWESK